MHRWLQPDDLRAVRCRHEQGRYEMMSMSQSCLCDPTRNIMSFDCLTTKPEFSRERPIWFNLMILLNAVACMFTVFPDPDLHLYKSFQAIWASERDWQLDRLTRSRQNLLRRFSSWEESANSDNISWTFFYSPSKSSKTKQQPYCLESHPDAMRWAGEGHHKQRDFKIRLFLDIFSGLERYVDWKILEDFRKPRAKPTTSPVASFQLDVPVTGRRFSLVHL